MDRLGLGWGYPMLPTITERNDTEMSELDPALDLPHESNLRSPMLTIIPTIVSIQGFVVERGDAREVLGPPDLGTQSFLEKVL